MRIERAIRAEAKTSPLLCNLLKEITKRLHVSNVDVRNAMWRLINSGEIEYTNMGRIRLM